MKIKIGGRLVCSAAGVIVCALAALPRDAASAEKLITIQSARVMSQAMPWIAQEAGLFPKYNLDFQLVYIASSGIVAAAMVGGNGDVALTGLGMIRAYVQGASDFVFVGSIKNILTHSILAGPEIHKAEDLKGKKIGISRFGSNSHYFTVQAVKRLGMDPARDLSFIQTGGEFETLAALAKGGIHAGTMTAPADQKALAQGFHYVVYGPDLRIPFLATALATRRSLIARRPQVVGQFMRMMAEAAKILHTDKEFAKKVLEKQLRLNDRKVLDASYDDEIKALEPKLAMNAEALQAILDEVSVTDARAQKVKPQELVDGRYLDEMEKSGFLAKLWGEKR
ncbi:MAG: ABC transporter substrate-binding protein [Deltaproteobacteria bacterium]|nr:ABC transporter substrate-binding protein [Deltaproteobacteria bacterium]